MSTKNKHIRCSSCSFARKDNYMSTSKWIAYECGNCESDYYGCLLNSDKNGNQQQNITWSGCPRGIRRTS